MPVIHVQHPLVRHKLGLLRENDISTKKFRELTGELGRLLAYEATADFPLEKTTIECWSGPIEIEQIAGKKVTVVPILRAGLGMLDGVLDMIPNAKVSVVGISRNHETLQPEHYFERFVGHLDERTALIIDPMLATAGSMIATVDLLKSRGCRDIRALVLVAALWADPFAAGVLALTGLLVPFAMALSGIGAAAASRRQFLALSRLQARFVDRVRGIATMRSAMLVTRLIGTSSLRCRWIRKRPGRCMMRRCRMTITRKRLSAACAGRSSAA